MSRIEVTGFENRGTAEHPFGFIEFSDGMRIGYAPGTRQANEDGLFNADQAYLLRDKEISGLHVRLATAWVREHLAVRRTAGKE